MAIPAEDLSNLFKEMPTKTSNLCNPVEITFMKGILQLACMNKTVLMESLAQTFILRLNPNLIYK